MNCEEVDRAVKPAYLSTSHACKCRGAHGPRSSLLLQGSCLCVFFLPFDLVKGVGIQERVLYSIIESLIPPE